MMATNATAKKRKTANIRPIHRETRHVFLRGLSCFKELHAKLLEGWTAQELARLIQERGEGEDLSEQALQFRVREYRDDLPPGVLATKRASHAIGNAHQKLREGLDELHEMEELYRLQMERLNIDFTHEKNMKKLLPTVTQEIRTAREILSNIADLKMDLGMTDRHLGTLGVNASLADQLAGFDNPKIAAVFASAERRQRLLTVATALVKKAGSTVIDAEGVAAKEAEGAGVLPPEPLLESSTQSDVPESAE